MKKKNETGNDTDESTTPDFEKSMARLETIVAEMESGDLSLEQMMARFEEGQKLLTFCSTRLNEIEKKIEILTRDGDAVKAEPFDPADTGDDNGQR
jgi:exodeoxyribonuclease VII small subunit